MPSVISFDAADFRPGNTGSVTIASNAVNGSIVPVDLEMWQRGTRSSTIRASSTTALWRQGMPFLGAT